MKAAKTNQTAAGETQIRLASGEKMLKRKNLRRRKASAVGCGLSCLDI